MSRTHLTLLRLAAMTCGLFFLLVLAQIVHLAKDRGLSGFMRLALFAAAVGAVLTFLAAVAPSQLWKRAAEFTAAWRNRLKEAVVPTAGGVSVGVVLLATASFGTIQGRFQTLHMRLEVNDQSAYLLVAHQVQQDGGPPALLRQLWTGEFAEANRHPLYIGLLSLRPSFEAGKRLSLAICLLGLLLGAAFVAYRFGPAIAAVWTVLLATNFSYCYSAALVTCEGLLIVLSGLAWLVLVDSRRTPTSRAWQWLAAGALLGAAFLAKGTGLLLLAGVVVWLSWPSDGSLRNVKWKPCGWLLLGWLIVASPLLVRNARRFGSPTYNVNSYLLFADEFEPPVALAESKSLGEAARDYWQTHTLTEMFQREATGLAWETFILCRSLGPSPLDDSRAPIGAILLLFAVAGLLAEARSDCWLVVLWTGLFVGVFAWYVPIAAGDRFLLPLLFPLLAYASCGLVRLASVVAGRRFAAAMLWAVLAWCGVWGIATWASSALPQRLTDHPQAAQRIHVRRRLAFPPAHLAVAHSVVLCNPTMHRYDESIGSLRIISG